MELSYRISERVNANFVRWREERIRIESPVKQELRRTVYHHSKVVLGRSRIRDRFCYVAAERRLRGLRKRWQMQSAVYPNAALHSRTRALSGQLEWCESDDKS